MSQIKGKVSNVDILIHDYVDPKGKKFLTFNSNSVSLSFPYDAKLLTELGKLTEHLLKKEKKNDKAEEQAIE